jgi:integrase
MEEGLKGTTILKIHTNIHKCLEYALVTLNLIPYNPADRVSHSEKAEVCRKFFDSEQLQQLFQIVKGEPLEPVVILAANYGLRRSEALGLRWQDVNFSNNTLCICHTAVEVSNHVTYSDQMKTKSSFRTLPLMKTYSRIPVGTADAPERDADAIQRRI